MIYAQVGVEIVKMNTKIQETIKRIKQLKSELTTTGRILCCLDKSPAMTKQSIMKNTGLSKSKVDYGCWVLRKKGIIDFVHKKYWGKK